jgi:hypothetical protein
MGGRKRDMSDSISHKVLFLHTQFTLPDDQVGFIGAQEVAFDSIMYSSGLL